VTRTEFVHPITTGRLLVVRKTLDDADLFEHQVRWLSRREDPGLAVLDRVDRAGLTYTTRYIGAHTLATWGSDPSRAFPVIGAVVAILLRLWRNGGCHGGLGLDHVVIGAAGPVLISPAPESPASDQPGADQAGPAGLVDMIALGRMIAELGHLWRVGDSASGKMSERWIAAGHAIDRIHPGERRRLAEIVARLRPD